MRGHFFAFAGIVLVSVLVFAVPSKADSVDFRVTDHWADTRFVGVGVDFNTTIDRRQVDFLVFVGDRPTKSDWDGREGHIEFRAWDFEWNRHHHHDGWDNDGVSTVELTDPTTTPTSSMTTTPEPASLALLAIGGLALASLRHRKSAET